MIYSPFKALADRVFALCGLIVLSPVLVALAVAVSFQMGRPVLFRQTRIGFGNRNFEFIKFRTMSDGRGHSGELLPDSERLTTLGSFLRSTSLDELPQLWNVV